MDAKIICKAIKFDSKDYDDALNLRDLVLRRPLKLKFDAEELKKEVDYKHFGAFADGKLVATLMLVPVEDRVYKLRQMAVDPEYQGKGIGKTLIAFAEHAARAAMAKEIFLHARSEAAPFYIKQRYKIYGEPFYEIGIQHRSLKKAIK